MEPQNLFILLDERSNEPHQINNVPLQIIMEPKKQTIRTNSISNEMDRLILKRKCNRNWPKNYLLIGIF